MAINFGAFTKETKARMGEAAEKPRQVEDSSGSWASIFTLDKAPYDLKFWKPSVGTNYIDIIPVEVTNPNNPAVKSGAVAIGDYDFGINIWTHPGTQASNNKPHVCLKSNYGKNCPRCEEFFRKPEEGGTFQKGVQGSGNKDHRRSARNYMIVVPRASKDVPGTEAFLWDAPASVKGGLPLLERAKEMADGDGIVFFWWPTEDGRTVSFEASEGAMKGSFDYSVIKFHRRPVEVAQALATKFSFPLDSLLIVPTKEDMERDIYGGPEASEAPATPPAYRAPATEPEMDPDAFGAPGAKAPVATPAPAAAPAPEAAESACPHGLRMGKDWETKPQCRGCAKSHESIYSACEALA